MTVSAVSEDIEDEVRLFHPQSKFKTAENFRQESFILDIDSIQAHGPWL
jgi:hypothetical protein